MPLLLWWVRTGLGAQMLLLWGWCSELDEAGRL